MQHVTARSNLLTIGVDEVGRGPWAGPLVVSAVALDMSHQYDGLNDSKKLTKKRRDIEAVYIKQVAAGIGIGWVDAPELDRLGMTASLKLAARRAYQQLPDSVKRSANQIVIDGNIAMLDDPRVLVMVKADAKVQAVEAASIVAKVARDNYMKQLAKIFPDYSFASHVGYGTKAHMEALNKYGVIPGVHRASFAPIKKKLGEIVSDVKPNRVAKTPGRIAEQAAADYLVAQGYEIIDRNWRTKFCEIDIVARRDNKIYFVEVKYRDNDQHGDGLSAITPTKLKQMKFAAELYMQRLSSSIKSQYDFQLMAVSLHGEPPTVDGLIKITD